MPKPNTFPLLYDELKNISISFLTKHKYLKPNQILSGTVNWSRKGEPTGSISILANTEDDSGYLELDYVYNKEKSIKYKVRLVTKQSNLGKGLVWFFICPYTHKRCRKLVLHQGYFYHRTAFTGGMYQKQTESKKYRYLDKTLGAFYRSDALYSEVNKKNFKKFYAGKATKKYSKIMRQLQLADQIPYPEIERLMLM